LVCRPVGCRGALFFFLALVLSLEKTTARRQCEQGTKHTRQSAQTFPREKKKRGTMSGLLPKRSCEVCRRPGPRLFSLLAVRIRYLCEKRTGKQKLYKRRGGGRSSTRVAMPHGIWSSSKKTNKSILMATLAVDYCRWWVCLMSGTGRRAKRGRQRRRFWQAEASNSAARLFATPDQFLGARDHHPF